MTNKTDMLKTVADALEMRRRKTRMADIIFGFTMMMFFVLGCVGLLAAMFGIDLFVRTVHLLGLCPSTVLRCN